MKDDNAPWMKLYTSLLDNDAFGNLDDSARMLIIGLWLYAARTGRHIFPADPRWLRRKIPMLNSDPDLEPLLEATDDCGKPTPFIRYCEAPAPEPEGPGGETPPPGKKRASKKKQKEQSRGEQSRGEQRREEERREEERREEESREDTRSAQTTSARRRVARGKSGFSSETTRGCAKQGISARRGRARKSTAEQSTQEQPDQSPSKSTTGQNTPEPAPDDPTKPDAQGRRKDTGVSNPAPGSDNAAAAHRGVPVRTVAAAYDKHDIQFGIKIFHALRLVGDPLNGAIDETTSFASTWRRIREHMGRAPPSYVDQVGLRLIKEAHRIAKRRSARNKAAVWNDTAPKIAKGHALK